MRKLLILYCTVIWVVLCGSCAVLTKSQVDMVNNLSIVSDSMTVGPSLIFQSLAKVREERGLFYAASFTSGEARYKEISSIADATLEDEVVSNKVDVYVKVMNSYLRSLRSVSNEIRWSAIGTEFRGLGRNIDSLLFVYNKLYPNYQIETGFAKEIGRTVGFLAEEITIRNQAIIVKEFVTQGDTLVASCCDALIELLRKQEVDQLIENEELGLEMNYRAYLNALALNGTFPIIDNDRKYLELKREINDTKKMRDKCVSSLSSLKNAHAKVLLELGSRKKIDQMYLEIIELNEQALDVVELVQKLKK